MLAKYIIRGSVFLSVIILFTNCSVDRVPATTAKKSFDKTNSTFQTRTLSPAKSNLSQISKSKLRYYMAQYIDTLDFTLYVSDKVNRKYIGDELKDFYKYSNYDLAWSSTDGPLPKSELMLGQLLTASSHGLKSEDYQVTALINLQQKTFEKPYNINLAELISQDVRLSISFITYSWHVHNGVSAPEIIAGRWVKERDISPVAEILAKNPINTALELLEPKATNYKGLKSALQLYSQISHTGGWPTLPGSVVLHEGDTSDYVPLLRNRLELSKDLNENYPSDSVMDEQLVNAVKRFQTRHGLTADGVVGKATIAALNVSVERRIDQIRLNLERTRWSQTKAADRYIYVNIPEYKLYVHEKDDLALEMRVIVGSQDNYTPVFSETLEQVVFSPTWKVPKSITVDEIIPKIKRDSGYLKRGQYELYKSWSATEPLNPDSIDWSTIDESSIRVVQKSGPQNALGKVKFLMPNSMSIYLHDTPARYLFSKDYRAMSHGCIRLESPDLLAEYLLKEQKWDIDKINEKMNNNEPIGVGLYTKVPVYIDYRTAWVQEDGLVNFREDIYGLDQIQFSPFIETVPSDNRLASLD